ncbi:hypothetical protein MRX96_010975 [Rhipicephalus microplus]
MAGAASPSPQRHLDTADEYQSSSPTTDAQLRRRPYSTGRSGGRYGSRRRGASMWDVSARASGTRSRTPTTSNSKKLTLSWADKAGGRRESPRGDESNRGSPHVSELDEMRRANKQLRKENAQIKQEMSKQAAEMAEN